MSAWQYEVAAPCKVCLVVFEVTIILPKPPPGSDEITYWMITHAYDAPGGGRTERRYTVEVMHIGRTFRKAEAAVRHDAVRGLNERHAVPHGRTADYRGTALFDPLPEEPWVPIEA